VAYIREEKVFSYQLEVSKMKLKKKTGEDSVLKILEI
jgi:hypothetical protein